MWPDAGDLGTVVEVEGTLTGMEQEPAEAAAYPYGAGRGRKGKGSLCEDEVFISVNRG